MSLFLFLILNTVGTGGIAQSADDHGNYLNNATNLSLGSSVVGRIDPGDDQDIFRLDLTGRSGNTDVWIYTTGELDTLGQLYDNSATLIVFNNDGYIEPNRTNFHLRRNLAPAIYYIGVYSADQTTTGNYTLHAKAVTDPGSTVSTAKPLNLGTPTAGRIDTDDDRDVFRLDLSGRTGTTDVWIYTTGDLDTAGGLYYSSGGQAFLWNDDSLIAGRRHNFHLRTSLVSGVYYVGVFGADKAAPTTGSYIIHAEAVTDPGSTISTANLLSLRVPTAGSIDTASDTDYFRLDLAKTTNVYLYARSVYGEPLWGWPVNSENTYVPSNVYLEDDYFYIRDDFEPGTHYIRVRTSSSVTSHPVPYTIHVFTDVNYTNFITNCNAATNALNDPKISDSLYGCQWHLSNSDGEDINVEPVWASGIDGTGVNIAVVDDGMDWSHEDLVDNVNTALNHDYTGNNDVHHPFKHHGTKVAGVIAARNNGVGVRGVAPRATIYGYNYLASDQTDAQRADAMTRNRVITAVSNNSWAPKGGPGLGQANLFWELGVESGITTGYSGKGILYVFGSGNSHSEGDNANLSELGNYYAVTTVCSVNDGDTRSNYSEMGANLWVCAPSGDRGGGNEYRSIVTVENYDRYVYDFSGTSAATPIVSGVAALMRQANPNLTWRDLKLILAASARKNDPTNTGWENGAQKYGATSTTDLYQFNHEYGFGAVDAKAAVDMAKTWSGSLPTLKDATAASGSLNAPIPDAPETGASTTVTRTLTLNTDIDFTEFVEINVTFDHPSFRDLDIDLVSPSGAVSQLTVPFDTFNDDDPEDDFIPLRGAFRLGSARHLGEDPNGVWQLRVTDHYNGMSGTLTSWDIKAYGHSSPPAGTGGCATGGAVPNASSNPGLVSDCDTLLQARDTLVGTGTSLNWSASTPITSWDGVTATGTPARVTELDLRNRGLRGTIPVQLGSLSALTSLNLSTVQRVCQGDVCRDIEESERNRLTGTIPATLGNLSNLEYLSLTRNQLTGSIPSEIGNLSNLILMGLGGNQLSGTVPAWLGNMTSLVGLFLWDNQLTGSIPTSLGSLSNLGWLEMGSNQLSGSIPVELGNLTQLQRLTLNSNQLTGSIPTQLGSLTNLKVLSLSNNQLTGAIPISLGNLSNLELLYLSQNQLTGCIPAALQNVAENDLADLGLPYCAGLTVSMTIASANALVRIDSPIAVTATFSEPVSGFTVDDVSVANGTASNFVGSDGSSVYTFDVTPNAIGAVTVDIAAGAAQDSDGNGNIAAAQLSLGIPYDDDGDGTINQTEVLTAVADYFRGALSALQVLAVVSLYFTAG